MQHRRIHVATGIALSLFITGGVVERASLAADTTAEARPNVLIVLTDDQGFGDVQSHDNPWIQTPHHDQLANQGARFERFFVSPVCAPTRASLLTGRWHLRTGVHGVTRGAETMRASEVTIAELFRAAGYATAAIGKWHNGAHYPEHPRGQGFDHFFGFCGGHFNNYFDSRLEDDDRTVPFDGFVADRLADRALQFIREHRQQPWLCYLAFNTPHSPWQVPDAYWQRYASRDDLPDDKARCAYAMVENIDDNLGRLTAELARLDLDQRTLVVFLTDNGANSDRYNAGMRGRKGSLHEGGSRVPCFVRWPGVIPAGQRVTPIAAHVDLLPTLCELAAVPLPAALRLDGVSLAPLLKKQGVDWPERFLFTHWGDDRQTGRPDSARGAVRSDRWRAVCEQREWQLFDMQNDPGQTTNVAAQWPEVTEQLAQRFGQWYADVTADGFDPIPIQIGRAEIDEVTLPAHEATLHPGVGQGIRYQGRAGWANDWIAGWTDPAAYATWPLQVASPGQYRITLHYAAEDSQVGNTLRVQLGDQQLEATVTQARPLTPIVGPDHVPRGEVAEASWARLAVGEVSLTTGPTRLSLHGVRKHSEEWLAIKAVSIRKLPQAAQGPRPNVLLIMADDMGFSDLGCYGGEIRTPNLDRLARQGVRFTSFYNNAKCEPTRASLLTGKYPHHVGAGARVVYRSPTFGEILHQAGYRTLMTGKWHAGQRPFERGFDRYFGLTDGCCNFFNPGEPRPGEAEPSHKNFPRRWAIDGTSFQPYSPTDPDFYTTDAFTDYALRYLDEYHREGRPFLLYVAFTAPHYPMHAPPEDVQRYRGTYRAGWHALRQDRYERLRRAGLFDPLPALSPPDDRSPSWDELTETERDDWDRRMAVYAAMVDRLDRNIGRLLDKLDEIGQTENTLVMFLSDNGGESDNSDWSRVKGSPPGTLDTFRTVGQPWANASNVPFRRYKTENHEGGIATPFIARWPGVIPPASVSRQVAHIIDILPTLQQLGAAPYPAQWKNAPLAPLPGQSLLAAFQNPSLQEPRTLYWQWQSAGAIRQGNWKLVRAKRRRDATADWELYDLSNDRTELHDLAAENPQRVAELAQQWQQWRDGSPTGDASLPP